MKAMTLPLVACCASLLLAGCGGGDDSTADSTATATVSRTTAVAVDTVAGASTATATQATAKTYTVQSGDTLSAIAEQFNTTVDVLAELNSLNDPNQLAVGQELKLP